MTLQPPDVSRHADLGADLALFPEASVTMISTEGELRPLSSAPLPGFSKDRGGGKSYWDLLVQPGRIWSEDEDGDWSRAAFPFALVNPLENETYNGLALFGYRQDRVTFLRIQLVQHTAPFLIREHLSGFAVVAMTAQTVEAPAGAGSADRETVAPWSTLEDALVAECLAGYDGAVGSPGLVASGIDRDGRFYLRGFDTPQGAWPYPQAARLGVWSVTKSALAGLAMLRLAAMFGDTILEERIVDHVPELAGVPAWRRVSFGHALCMATAVGCATGLHAAQGMTDDALEPGYRRWYLAPSATDKLAAIAADSVAEPWEPGTTFRYRDQDLFAGGIAMERFCAERCGRPLQDVLREDVFVPLGIGDIVYARTMETEGATGSPIWAFGLYPTLIELARIGRLLHAEGMLDGQQILSASLIRAVFAGGPGRGVPTDRTVASSGVTYCLTFWCAPFTMPDGRRVICPQMLGYGGNEVLLLPNGITMIRIGHDATDMARPEDRATLARIGMSLAGSAR